MGVRNGIKRFIIASWNGLCDRNYIIYEDDNDQTTTTTAQQIDAEVENFAFRYIIARAKAYHESCSVDVSVCILSRAHPFHVMYPTKLAPGLPQCCII